MRSPYEAPCPWLSLPTEDVDDGTEAMLTTTPWWTIACWPAPCWPRPCWPTERIIECWRKWVGSNCGKYEVRLMNFGKSARLLWKWWIQCYTNQRYLNASMLGRVVFTGTNDLEANHAVFFLYFHQTINRGSQDVNDLVMSLVTDYYTVRNTCEHFRSILDKYFLSKYEVCTLLYAEVSSVVIAEKAIEKCMKHLPSKYQKLLLQCNSHDIWFLINSEWNTPFSFVKLSEYIVALNIVNCNHSIKYTN